MKKKENLLVVSGFVLVLLLAFIATASAGVGPKDGRDIGDNGTAIIGETNLRFDGISHGTLESTWEGSNIIIPFSTPFDTTSEYVKEKLVEGRYKVVGAEKTIHVYFISPDLYVTTKVKAEDFSWVIKGDNITFEPDTNLHLIKGPQPNNITYKLENPRGGQLYKVGNVWLINISVSTDGGIQINTTDLEELGKYTLSIETDPGTNNGLDAEGPSIEFTVKDKCDIIIEANPEVQTINKGVVFTVTTYLLTNITLNVTSGISSNVWFQDDIGDVKVGGYSASGESDEEGIFKAEASFAESGLYTIKATELNTGSYDKISVTIKEFEAKFSSPAEKWYYIGKDNITIKGGSGGVGDNITIKIDDAAFKRDADVDSFEYDWPEEYKTLGMHTIKMWVLPLSNPERDPADDSVTIILLRGGLTAEVSADYVARGDEFSIEGTAPGRNQVDVLTMAPKGGGGKGLDADDVSTETRGDLNAPGITHFTCSVDNDKYKKEKVKISKDVDTGTYQIIVLNYGLDKVWGTKTGTNNLLEAMTSGYRIDLATKTPEEILAILVDKTVGQPGSDDLMGITKIKVENGFVQLDDIEDVPLGSELKVTGVTNRETGTPVVITAEGPTKLKPQIVTVAADDKKEYNKFEASFGTVAARIGKYTVTAVDNDEHRDTTTVNLILAEEPVINKSLPSPVPTIEEEPTNESINETAANVTLLSEAMKQPAIKLTFAGFVLILALVAVWFIVSTREKPSALIPQHKVERRVERKKLHTLPRGAQNRRGKR